VNVSPKSDLYLRLSEATLKYRDITIDSVMKFFMREADGKILEEAVRLKIDPKKFGRTDNYEGS